MRNTTSVLFLVCFILIALSSTAQDVSFERPLKGIPGKDYWISYYMDHDSTSVTRDAYCGSITYNGHMGTDFAIRGFGAMDSGVAIYAVAAGVVTDSHDGEFDRNTVRKKGAVSNRVIITHANGLRTTYLHMKKGSVAVTVGDTIQAGQLLGLVGSSGVSNGPHLHLEVNDANGKVVDPFAANCNEGHAGLWKEQLPYDTAFYIIDYGFLPYKITEHQLDPTVVKRSDTLTIGPKDFVSFWTTVHGLKKGSVWKTEWYDSYGDHLFGYENKNESFSLFQAYWSYVDLGGRGMAGRCWVKVFINEKEVLTLPFNIIRKTENEVKSKEKKGKRT